jgi:hypothetical protein
MTLPAFQADPKAPAGSPAGVFLSRLPDRSGSAWSAAFTFYCRLLDNR